MAETLDQIIAKLSGQKPTFGPPRPVTAKPAPKIVQKGQQTAVKRSPNPFVQAVEQAFKPTTPTKPQEPNLGQIIKQFKDVASSGRKQRGETLMQEYIRNTQPVSGNMGFKAGSGKGATIEAEMAAYDRKTFGAETYGKRPKGVSTAEWSKRQSHKGKFKQLAGTRNEQVAELDREIEAYKLENMTPVQRLELARETAGGLPGFYDKERASALAASLMGSQDLKDKTDASLFIRAANQVMQPVSTAYTVAMKDPRSLAEMPVGLQVGLSAGDLGAQIVGGFLTGGGSTPATASTLARIGAVATRSLALDAPGYIQMIEDAGGVDKALVAYKDMIGKALDPNSKISASERVNGIALAGMIVLSGGGKIAGKIKGGKPTPDLPTKPLDVEAPPARTDLDPVADAYSKWQGMDGEEVPNAKAATKTIKPKPEAVPPSVESVRGEVGSVGLDAQPKVRGRKTEQATGSDVKPEAGRVGAGAEAPKPSAFQQLHPQQMSKAGDGWIIRKWSGTTWLPKKQAEIYHQQTINDFGAENTRLVQDSTNPKLWAVELNPNWKDATPNSPKIAGQAETLPPPTPKPTGNPSRGAGRAAGAKVADQPAPEPKPETVDAGLYAPLRPGKGREMASYQIRLKDGSSSQRDGERLQNGLFGGIDEKGGAYVVTDGATGRTVLWRRNRSEAIKALKSVTPEELSAWRAKLPKSAPEPVKAEVEPKEAWEMTKAEAEADAKFHGTSTDFDRFDLSKSKAFGGSKFGHWFTGDEAFATAFGDKIRTAKLNIKNPKVISDAQWNKIREAHAKDGEWFKQWKQELISQGHDGLHIKGKPEMFAGREMPASDIWAAFSDDQVSAIDHRAAVQKALSEGKPVPASVLADYPDLKPKQAEGVQGAAVPPKEPAQREPKVVADFDTRFNAFLANSNLQESDFPYAREVMHKHSGPSTEDQKFLSVWVRPYIDGVKNLEGLLRSLPRGAASDSRYADWNNKGGPLKWGPVDFRESKLSQSDLAKIRQFIADNPNPPPIQSGFVLSESRDRIIWTKAPQFEAYYAPSELKVDMSGNRIGPWSSPNKDLELELNEAAAKHVPPPPSTKPTVPPETPAPVKAKAAKVKPDAPPVQEPVKARKGGGATAGMTREEIYASADLKARDAITKSLSSKRISDVLPDLRSKINTLDEQEALIYWQELGHESERLRNSNRTNGTYEVARDLLDKRLQSIRDGSVQQATQESITPTSSKRNRRSESGDASEPQGVVGSPGNGPIRREYFIEHDRHLNVDIRKRETEGHEHIIVHSAIAGRIPDPSVVPSYITSLQFVNGDDARAFAHARQWIEPWRGDNGDWYTAANRNTAAGLKSNTGVHADQAGNGPTTPSPSRTAQTKAKLDEALENFKTEHGKLHAVSNPKQEAAKLASTVDLLKALLDHAAASAGEFVLKTADDFIKFTSKRLGRDLTEGEVARHKQAWEQVHKKAEGPATGLARQFEDPERIARDLEETRAPAKSIQKLVDETQADWDKGGSTKADQALRRANDPEYAPTREQIVKDTAMVAHLKREVKNEYDKLLRKENLSGQDFADIQAVEAKLDEIDQYAQKIRTHWHDVGMALQIAYKPDFTVADLTMRARAANGGDISPDAQKQINDWVSKYEAAQKELDELRKAKPPKEVSGVAVSKPRAARAAAFNRLANLGLEVRGEDGALVAPTKGGGMKGGKQAGAVTIPKLTPSMENELRKSIRQIAKAYIVDEHPIAGSLDGVVTLVRKHLPSLSEEDILRYLSDRYHRVLLDSDLQRRESQAFMRRIQAAADYRNKTLLEKGFAQAGALLNTTQRGLQASMDLSAPFRQGRRVMVTKEWVNAWLPSTKAMFAKDPQKAMELHSAELARSPYYLKGVESGLGISSASKPEEVWAGRLLQDWAAGKGLAAGKANPLRAYANLIQRSEAHYTIFLNDLRMRLFENLAKRNPNDKEYLESIAQMINVMTGRGHGKTATMLSHPAAGNVFYAPRYAWSEVQSTGMVPIWKTKSKMARQEAIKAYGRNFAVTVVGLSLARLFGNEVELDPRGTDFLKVRLQNGKVVDVLGASQQYLRLLVRMGYGSVSRKGFYSEPGAFGADPLMQAVNNKLSPAARSLLGLLRGWASPNADGDWQKQPPGMVLRDSVTPMGARKTGDQMWSDGDKWALLNLLGIDYEKGQPNKRQKKGSRPPKLEGLPQGMRQFAGHAPITGR